MILSPNIRLSHLLLMKALEAALINIFAADQMISVNGFSHCQHRTQDYLQFFLS